MGWFSITPEDMRIDGKAIAEGIFQNLTQRVEKLKQKNVTPKLVIILVGDDPASTSYVRQKELKAKLVGVETTTEHLSSNISQSELLKTIQQYNNDSNVHGIIVQRPLPSQINIVEVDSAVDPQKDVDGFRSDSPFLPPLGIAVYRILQDLPDFKSKKIVIMGKGKTGGSPVMQVLDRREIPYALIDSKTSSPQELTKQADIIISAVGKHNVIKKEMIKQNAILIGVGMHRGEDGKLYGDYEEEDIKDTVSLYTPIPGGVGPVNVAMLLQNVVTAAESQTNNPSS